MRNLLICIVEELLQLSTTTSKDTSEQTVAYLSLSGMRDGIGDPMGPSWGYGVGPNTIRNTGYPSPGFPIMGMGGIRVRRYWYFLSNSEVEN